MSSSDLRRIGDATLRAVDEGEGAPVVLLHGWSYDLHLWDDLARVLVGEGWRVVRPDLRGHGGSPAHGPYPFTQLSADLKALLDHLDLRRPVMGGLSLGGFLAMRHAIDHPDGVRALLLADTWTTPIPSDSEMAQTLPSTAEGADALRRWWTSRYGEVGRDPERMAARERFAGLDADGLRHAISACAQRDAVTDAELARITAPTLVITGEHDRYFTPAMHQHLADCIPDARLEVLRGAGHISVRDAPEPFASAVLPFLRTVRDTRETSATRGTRDVTPVKSVQPEPAPTQEEQ